MINKIKQVTISDMCYNTMNPCDHSCMFTLDNGKQAKNPRVKATLIKKLINNITKEKIVVSPDTLRHINDISDRRITIRHVELLLSESFSN